MSKLTGFIDKFHTLTGTTIGERRKELFALLRNTQDVDACQLQPKTLLEEVFKIEVLVHFQKFPDLLATLGSENPILIEKILRQPPLIHYVSKNVNGDELIDLFRTISYNTKLKFMNKLVLHLENTARADEYFHAIKNQYGLYLASKILAACSYDLIITNLATYRIEVTPRQLLTIVKKNPACTEDIFEKLHKHNERNFAQKYSYVFKYLLKHDLCVFLKVERYKPSFRIGARATKTFIGNAEDIVLENPSQFYNLLKKRQIGKTIKDFEKMYYKFLPKSLEAFKSTFDEYFSLLQHIPSKAKKLQVMLEAFRNIYDSELWEHPSLVSARLIEMMTPDDRIRWMEQHTKPSFISENTWIGYLKTEESIPKLLETISYTSNLKARMRLVTALVKTCEVNGDTTALLVVLKHVISKHRNDHPMVREEFLRVLSSSFRLSRLEAEHWRLINEFLLLFKLDNSHYYVVERIEEEYLYFCFSNNLPVRELLVQQLKSGRYQYSMCKRNPAYEKRCLQLFLEILPLEYSGEELRSRSIQYLSCLQQWNNRYPNDKLSLHINDTFDAYIAASLDEEITTAYILENFQLSQKLNLLKLLLKKDYCYRVLYISGWLLRKYPQVFLDNLDSLVDHMIKHCSLSPVIRQLTRYYTHLGIPQKISQLCLDKIKTDNNSRYIVNLLVCVATREEFLDLVPMQLNLHNKPAYKLQQVVLPHLRSIVPPSLALECILHFCRGDYLKNIQRSLFSASYNVNEDTLTPFLVKLCSEGPVSVRKHAIFLAFKVLSLKHVYALLTNSIDTETNASIMKSVFKGIFNLFLRNCDEYSWNMTKGCLKVVDAKDVEVFKILTKCRRVPPGFFIRYVLFAWDIVDAYQHDLDLGKCRILDSVTCDVVTMLPKKFSRSLIERNFLKCDGMSSLQESVQDFTSRYVIYSDVEFLKSVFESLKTYIKSAQDSQNRQIVQGVVLNFVKKFCSYYLNRKCNSSEALELFVVLWNELLKPHQAYDEFLYVQFTLIFYNSASLVEIGQSVSGLCNSLTDQGCFVPNFFCNSFNLFKSHFLSESEHSVEEGELILLESILKYKCSISSLCLVANLLPGNLLMTARLKNKYDFIMNLLLEATEPVVQIHLQNYLRNRLEF